MSDENQKRNEVTIEEIATLAEGFRLLAESFDIAITQMRSLKRTSSRVTNRQTAILGIKAVADMAEKLAGGIHLENAMECLDPLLGEARLIAKRATSAKSRNKKSTAAEATTELRVAEQNKSYQKPTAKKKGT